MLNLYPLQKRNGRIILFFTYVDVTFTTRRMSQYQEDQKESVLNKGDRLEKLGWESYLNTSN
jgi:hypothetical protein